MKILTEIISNQIFIISLIPTFFSIYLLYKSNVLINLIDPVTLIFFQLLYTFFVLNLINEFKLMTNVYFVFFILLLIIISNIKIKRIKLFSSEDWIEISNIFFIFLLLVNFILIYRKGFILFINDFSSNRVTFYHGYGIFKRLNQLGTYYFTIISFIKFNKDYKKSLIFLLFAVYLYFTMGSRSGIISIIFIYGVYIYFNNYKVNYKFVGVSSILVVISTLFLFYLGNKEKFLSSFIFRIASYTDGPFYYFRNNLNIRYNIDYIWDQLFVVLRIRDSLKYISLGPKINQLYFDYSNLLVGPNPQIFVEARALFGNLEVLYYLIIGFLFQFSRKIIANEFEFVFWNFLFLGPLLIDIQYAFNNFVTLLMMYLLFFIFRFILIIKKNFIRSLKN